MFVNARTGQKADKLRIPPGTDADAARRAFELAGWEFPPDAVEEDGFFILGKKGDKAVKKVDDQDGEADE
jgi:hypothetical protein